MEKLIMCRICLATDLRMESIVNTHLQDMYEKLTLKQFETKDSKPTLACYLCCARLQNCYQLSMNCLQSEELLTQMLSGKMSHPSNLEEVTRSMKLGTTPVIVETFEDLLYDVDGQVKVDSTQSSGVETEVKMVVNEVVEDSIPAGCIKEEPGTDDSFQDEDIEDEIPLDIVKHEFGLPSILKDKKPADQMENLKSSWMGELQTSEQGSSDAEENTRDYCSNGKVKCKTLVKTETTDTYTCSSCHKTFVRRAQLTRHMKTHIGKKTVKCNLCEKNFTSKTKLGKHILHNHIQENPFPCNKCGEGFMVTSHLNRHIALKHVDWNKYVCEYCSEVHRSKTDIKNHVRSNHSQKPVPQPTRYPMHAAKKEYKCELCHKSYIRRRSYVLHYTLNHQ